MSLYLGNDKISRVSIAFDGSGAASGTDTNDATLTSGAQMLSGVTAYSKGTKYTGTIPTVEGPEPTVSVSNGGLITASVSNPKGYQSSATTKTVTQQLTTKAATTITPSSASQTAVDSGVYTTGKITVSAVPTETKTITTNGTYNPTSGKYFSSVTVNVPAEEFNTQTKTVTPTESTQTVSPDNGYDGLSTVTVNPISSTYVGSAVPTKGATTITPNSNSQTAISSGTYATGDIIVSAVPTETKSITANGTYTPSDGKYFSSVSVSVVGDTFDTQEKSVTPTESEQVIGPDAGYDGLSSVTVGAISSTYIGSGITRKSAETYTPTESEQIISVGQYLDGDQTIAAIPSTYVGSGVTTKGTATIIPSISVQTAVSAGTYVTGDVLVAEIPENYVDTSDANATASDIAVNKTAYINGVKVVGNIPIPTSMLSGLGHIKESSIGVGTTASVGFGVNKKIILDTDRQYFVEFDKTSLGDAIATDVISGKTFTSANGLKITGTMPSKDAATYTPSTTNQTIDAGQYLSGAQTIQGDANLIPENIASGVSIFGVTGTHQGGGTGLDTSDATATDADIVSGKTAYVNGTKLTGTLIVQNYYTGTTTPESTTGEDGDLYFKVVR